MEQSISIRGLFNNYVVLRDLEPTKAGMPGLSALREKLDIPPNVTPRKNEPDYAKVVEAFVNYVSGGNAKNILYTGDTVFNDGNVVKNIATREKYDIIGFICNEDRQRPSGDFLLCKIIFSNKWSHLWKLVQEGLRKGFAIDPTTVAIFDLDHTVYAAKGREGEPLKQARLEGITNFLRDVMGTERYDPERIERYYREFDRDVYHRFTRDNQDYVVFLTLICSLGLIDVEGVRKDLAEPGKSIISLIERMRSHVERRKANENLEKVWMIVQEIYFNTRVGDQTPCKLFREYEYLSTTRWMATGKLSDEQREARSRITTTREIVDLIHFLRQRGVAILALSDRPREATEPSETYGSGHSSILDIKMLTSGESIVDKLEEIGCSYS